MKDYRPASMRTALELIKEIMKALIKLFKRKKRKRHCYLLYSVLHHVCLPKQVIYRQKIMNN